MYMVIDMRMALTILLNKFVNFLSKKLLHKEGSVIGGYFSLKFYPKVLSKIKYPKYIIGVTGSSGKSSTTELINHILTESGLSVAYNKAGSNVINGIATLILDNASINGSYNKDVLLMELDERYMKEIFKYFKPTHLIITNITRDQPPRNVHPDNIYNEIENVITDDMHLILNADDPMVKKLSIKHRGKATYYGMDKNEYSNAPILNNIDASYCPICNLKLKYKYYQYGHIGDYKCTKCDFGRGKPEYIAHNIDIKNRTIYINKEKINIPSSFLYAAYFTLAAYTLADVLGINKEDILYSLNTKQIKTKRLNIYELDNRKWQMLASKNENNLSYKQSLDYIVNTKEVKTVILGFENSSRRYRENDISWIWDIDFEELNNSKITNILIVGRFKYDVLTRLIYAGIDPKKIILIDDINNILNILVSKTKGTIYSMVCFDMEIILKKLLEGEKNEN